MSKWKDPEMPFGSGIFRLSEATLEEYNPEAFSQILNPQTTGEEGEFAIFPNKGGVWALYRGCNLKMKFSDFERFEY